jgi:hypothetical protein
LDYRYAKTRSSAECGAWSAAVYGDGLLVGPAVGPDGGVYAGP